MRIFSAIDDIRALLKVVRGSSGATPPGPDVFYLDPAHHPADKPFRLRRKMIVSTSIRGIILLLVLAGVLTTISLAAYQTVLTERNLEESGVPTRATVTNCEKLKNGRPSVTYTYVITDASGTATAFTDEALGDYNQFCVEKGSTIGIKYLADDPTTTKITEPGLVSDGASIGNFIWVSPVAAILVLMWLAYTWRHIGSLWRYRQYRARGRVLKGRVISANWRKGRGRLSLRVVYEFRTPQGRTIKANQSRIRADLVDDALPEMGTPVRILYASDGLYKLL